MSKLVIIEGCDNSGKSTLIQSLASDLRVATARSFGKPRNYRDILEYHSWASLCPQPLVLDRHPAISDLIYGPIIRGKTHGDANLATHCLEESFLIYCRPPNAIIGQGVSDRPQMEGVVDNLHKISRSYDLWMAALSPQFRYDYTNPEHYSQLKEKVSDYLTSAD